MERERNSYRDELQSWRTKYSDLELQFNNFRSSSGGDLDRLNI